MSQSTASPWRANPMTNLRRPEERGPATEATQPARRERRSYSIRQKEEVMAFFAHHRIYDPKSVRSDEHGWREPTMREMTAHFHIPGTTMNNWIRNKNVLPLGRQKQWRPRWPELERELVRRWEVAQRHCIRTPRRPLSFPLDGGGTFAVVMRSRRLVEASGGPTPVIHFHSRDDDDEFDDEEDACPH
ncbi:hypothetical protein XA68_14919 [Ophiocordyceps unilateralis]|uniref:Uncharacterized protein n=1 Tax=Ophiocordyceps unilateralis TaxID=268505 RepID=A0A2A9P9L0_OPHUN|nr:hypothetical protein XA68_14919 [Ophiocordyceps unilateralis]